MSYSINFHPLAQADYDHIYDYIAKRSPDGAVSWDEALDGALARLKSDPNIYSTIPERLKSKREYKQTFFKTKYGNRYRAVYAVEGTQVTILRIRGQGQKPLARRDLPNG